MLNLDPDKNCRIYLFGSSIVLVVVFALWPYLLGFIVLYAIAKGLSNTHHHSSRRKRSRQSRRSRW